MRKEATAPQRAGLRLARNWNTELASYKYLEKCNRRLKGLIEARWVASSFLLFQLFFSYPDWWWTLYTLAPCFAVWHWGRVYQIKKERENWALLHEKKQLLKVMRDAIEAKREGDESKVDFLCELIRRDNSIQGSQKFNFTDDLATAQLYELGDYISDVERLEKEERFP